MRGDGVCVLEDDMSESCGRPANGPVGMIRSRFDRSEKFLTYGGYAKPGHHRSRMTVRRICRYVQRPKDATNDAGVIRWKKQEGKDKDDLMERGDQRTMLRSSFVCLLLERRKQLGISVWIRHVVSCVVS
jgi:hypothetical protein